MNRMESYRHKFKLISHNDLQEPLDAARFQNVVFKFMEDVRSNVWSTEEGEVLMNDFCDYVKYEEVWHLAQMIVPEFRLALEEQ